jgi:hypothetical protein
MKKSTSGWRRSATSNGASDQAEKAKSSSFGGSRHYLAETSSAKLHIESTEWGCLMRGRGSGICSGDLAACLKFSEV